MEVPSLSPVFRIVVLSPCLQKVCRGRSDASQGGGGPNLIAHGFMNASAIVSVVSSLHGKAKKIQKTHHLSPTPFYYHWKLGDIFPESHSLQFPIVVQKYCA